MPPQPMSHQSDHSFLYCLPVFYLYGSGVRQRKRSDTDEWTSCEATGKILVLWYLFCRQCSKLMEAVYEVASIVQLTDDRNRNWKEEKKVGRRHE